jgi:hypothetical protein
MCKILKVFEDLLSVEFQPSILYYETNKIATSFHYRSSMADINCVFYRYSFYPESCSFSREGIFSEKA